MIRSLLCYRYFGPNPLSVGFDSHIWAWRKAKAAKPVPAWMVETVRLMNG